MVKDIFGSVVPSFIDFLYSIFFPAGTHTFKWSILLMAIIFGFYFVDLLLYRALTKRNQRALTNIFLMLSVGFILGLFVPILLGFFLIYLLTISISYLIESIQALGFIKSDKSSRIESNRGDLGGKKPKPIRIPIVMALYALLLIECLLYLLLIISGFLITILIGWWSLGIMLELGIMSGLVFILIRNPMKMDIYNRELKMSAANRKKLISAMLVIPILFGSVFFIGNLPKSHLIPTDNTTGIESGISIMTFNIRTGTGIEADMENQWHNRKGEFTTYLDGFNLDIFGIQEAHIFQILYLEGNLNSRNYYWTGKGRDDGLHGGEACAIFYDSEKFEYVDGDTYWHSETPWIQSKTPSWNNDHIRVTTWARLRDKSSKTQFMVFNTHCDWETPYRENALLLIKDKIKEYSGNLPVILIGDFNFNNATGNPVGKYYNYMLDSSGHSPMNDAYSEYMMDKIGYVPNETTSPNDWNVTKTSPFKSRIDFFFLSQDISINNCTVLKDYYGNYRTYSDHYPVYLNCTF